MTPRESPRLARALRRAGRGAVIALVAGFVLYTNPSTHGPLLFVESLVNGVSWGIVTFAVILTYRLARPARA
jgi:hypothetical protein